MSVVRALALGALGGGVAGAWLGLGEALYHASSGVPDGRIFPYAVVLYGLLGVGPGVVGGGIGAAARGKGGDAVLLGLGGAAALVPLAGFSLRYVANKVVYAEAGVPMSGNLGVLVGAVALALAWVLVSVGLGFAGKAADKGAGWGSGALAALVGALGLGASAGLALTTVSALPDPGQAHPKPMSEKLKGRPNVLVLFVDTLRADALGTYGAPGRPTPVLDQLAAEGIVFEQHIAQASWTRSSGASFLASRIPSGHNAALKAARLPEAVVTWPEVLDEGGVVTGALINNINLTSTFGFDQGFDTFLYEAPDYPFGASESVFNLTFYKVVHKLSERALAKNKAVTAYYQPADRVLGDAMSFIEAHEGKRWSLFVHLMEPHDPYFEHPSLKGGGAEYNGVGFARAEVEKPENTPENIGYLQDLYAGEVKFLDLKLAPFIAALREKGVYDETLIVVTADHGEEFGEHGGFWHGTTLYDEQVHVPLILKLPKGAEAGTRVPWQSRSIDVGPTITKALGLVADKSWEGTDLLGDVADWKAENDAIAVWKSGAGALGNDPALIPPPSTRGVAPEEAGPCADRDSAWTRTAISEENFEGNVLASIRKQGFKWIKANAGNPRGLPEKVLYDVVADPKEVKDLLGGGTICGTYPNDLGQAFNEEMMAAIKKSALGATDGGQACVSDEDAQRLIALGYMDEAGAEAQKCQK